MMMTAVSMTALKGVGPKNAKLLADLHILTLQDLLFHLPFRYEDRTRLYRLAEVQVGDRVLIEATIQSLEFFGPKKYLRCVVTDDTHHRLTLVFFQFSQYHQKKLAMLKGKIRFFGEIQIGMMGQLQIAHPEYAAVSAIAQESVLALSPCLLPVYPATKGLSQGAFRKWMREALILLDNNILPELLPPDILHAFAVVELKEALRWIHFPPVDVDMEKLTKRNHPAQQRLIIEELLAHRLHLQTSRDRLKKQGAATLAFPETFHAQLKNVLSFQLTEAQKRVLADIEKDFEQGVPMLRLVQGDVGSGKTIVACFAALHAIAAGYQVALMVPTEILAEQHYQNFLKWLTPLNIRVGFLTGKQKLSLQRETKSQIMSGEIALVVGTHALFQEECVFKNLGLLIIDEQHRFGVQQRLALMEKGKTQGLLPHQLIMTATPIPRTLTMTAYADLDVSVIDELPPGRQPITTVLISANKRDEIIARVFHHCQEKKQAYWICTLIDESDILECQAAEVTLQLLIARLPALRIGLVHGRLKPDEKKQVMENFQLGMIDLLVATTVVEVGVDVSNASLMIIENPERLGLAQLHQLRGRVGRGKDASFCVLLYQSPLSVMARERLRVMRESQDGFFIAEQDLKLRGPGDVLGVRQSGLMQFRVADLCRDEALLPKIDKLSQTLSMRYPTVPALLVARWIGAAEKYLHA